VASSVTVDQQKIAELFKKITKCLPQIFWTNLERHNFRSIAFSCLMPTFHSNQILVDRPSPQVLSGNPSPILHSFAFCKNDPSCIARVCISFLQIIYNQTPPGKILAPAGRAYQLVLKERNETDIPWEYQLIYQLRIPPIHVIPTNQLIHRLQEASKYYGWISLEKLSELKLGEKIENFVFSFLAGSLVEKFTENFTKGLTPYAFAESGDWKPVSKTTLIDYFLFIHLLNIGKFLFKEKFETTRKYEELCSQLQTFLDSEKESVFIALKNAPPFPYQRLFDFLNEPLVKEFLRKKMGENNAKTIELHWTPSRNYFSEAKNGHILIGIPNITSPEKIQTVISRALKLINDPNSNMTNHDNIEAVPPEDLVEILSLLKTRYDTTSV